MNIFTAEGKNVSVFSTTFPGAPVIYLNTYSDEGQQLFEATQTAGYPPFTLVAISDLDWNHDMAPWDSPVAFKNGEPFTGGWLPATTGGGDHTQGRKRADRASSMAGDRWILFGWPVRPVYHLPDRCILPGWVHVWLSVVSWFQGIRPFP